MQMNRIVKYTLLVLSLVLLLSWFADGLFSRTEVSQSVNAPDGKLRCSITIYGAFFHNYSERSKKDVWVWIGSGLGNNAAQLFVHKYIISGPDVGWNTHWISSEAVSVDLFDCGDGVYSGDVGKSGVASNHIATLSFHLDKQTGKFVDEK
jgi:hypothetical protein